MRELMVPSGMSMLPFLLRAVTFSMFWIIVPRKRRWRDSVCLALCMGFYILMYGVHRFFPSMRGAPINRTTILLFVVLTVLATAMVLVVSGLVCVDTWPRRVLMSVNMTVVFLLSEIVMEGIQVYVIHQPLDNELSLWTMQILCPIVSLALTAISATFWNYMDVRMRRRIVLLAVVLATSQCTCMYGMEVWNREVLGEKMMIYFGLLALLSLTADVVLYQLIARAIVARRKQMEMKQLREKQEMEYYYYHLLQQRAEEQAKFRHDFKNQIQVLYTLLCSGDRERSEEMLTKMRQRLGDSQIVSYTAMPVVNAILNAWATRAERHGMTLEADIDTEDWQMEELDQYVLFDRLLRMVVLTGRADKPDSRIYLSALQNEENRCILRVRWTRQPTPERKKRQLNERDPGEAEWQVVRQRMMKKYQGVCREGWEQGWYRIELSLRENKAS